MTKLESIPKASVECLEDGERSRKAELIRRLEDAGHQVIAIGRAVVTIERTDSEQEVPRECQSPDVLKVSIYSDPDVSGEERPVCLYVEGGRFGLASAFLQICAPDGRQRIFRMEERLVRDEF